MCLISVRNGAAAGVLAKMIKGVTRAVLFINSFHRCKPLTVWPYGCHCLATNLLAYRFML